MSDIRFNRWLHQSGTGGVYQDSAGNVGIGTSVPTTALDVQGGNLKIGSNTLSSSGVSTFTTINATTVSATSIVGVTTAGITTVYTNSVNDGPLAGFRNFIINGNMAISQRGTSFTTINTYNLDRYRTFGGPITHTITQQDSIATYSPSRYALRAARNSGATETNELGIAQGIETQNSYALRGKTVTVSFRARCGANFSSASSALLVRVFSGTGTDENPVGMTGLNADISQAVTLTTSLQTFSVTGTLSASLTQATLAFSYTATGTAGANDWFEITDVQLEIGNRATPFERRPYGQELALCERYCQSFSNARIAVGTWNTGTTAFCTTALRTAMRTTPSLYSYTAGKVLVESVNWYTATTVALTESSNTHVTFYISGITNSGQAANANATWGNGAEAVIQAEL